MTSKHPFFKSLENEANGTRIELVKTLDNIPWNQDGLIPVIAQDDNNGTVLMLAWANREALTLSIQTHKGHYWSRSRQALWCKGESSGHHQQIVSIHLDCDGDAILYKVIQSGAACHTLRPHCFYWKLDENGAHIDSPEHINASEHTTST